jgi:hypothetical protein
VLSLTHLCTFRTDVAAVREQSWWMFRDANHIGRIWADGGHRAFHFQNMEPVDVGLDRYSGAMVVPPERRAVGVAERRCYRCMKLSTESTKPKYLFVLIVLMARLGLQVWGSYHTHALSCTIRKI